MNDTMTATHPVAPEEIMVWIDGELSASESEAISAHLDQCMECGAVAQQLRETSLSLAQWNVAPIPHQLEETIRGYAAEAVVPGKGAVKPLSLKVSPWNWRLWIVGGGSAAAAMLVLFAAVWSVTNYQSRPQRVMTYIDPQASDVDAFRSQPARSDSLSSTDKQLALNAYSSGAQGSLSKGIIGGVANFELAAVRAPMIARTASLSIRVKDITAARASVDALLVRHRGYSAQRRINTDANSPRFLQASLRVPAPDLSLAVNDLRTLGRVESESQSGEEVSQQHADLVQRLKTARDTEERFRSILQQRTGNVSDVLNVEESIARVRGQIESMEAEQAALEHRVDFATIELYLVEEYRAQLDSPSVSASTRLRNAFVAGYRNTIGTLLGIFLFFVEFGPSILIWLAILGIPAFLIWRRYRKARTNI